MNDPNQRKRPACWAKRIDKDLWHAYREGASLSMCVTEEFPQAFAGVMATTGIALNCCQRCYSLHVKQALADKIDGQMK